MPEVIISYTRKDNSGLGMISPSCQQEHPIAAEQPGSEFSYQTDGCGLQLKLNPFVITSASGEESWA